MQTHFKIQYKTTVKAPIEKVWDALTNPEIVKQYLFGTEMITTWEVGDDIICKGEWEGKTYLDKGKVLEYVHNKQLSYTYLSSWSGMEDKPENYLLVCYEVKAIDKGTVLTISQTNYDEEKAKHSEENWATLIEVLKKIIE
jgi:uncharacterized protein YndB with AHSA1/START domain